VPFGQKDLQELLRPKSLKDAADAIADDGCWPSGLVISLRCGQTHTVLLGRRTSHGHLSPAFS
ncbi:MAG: hypothetical protein JSW59_18335, partial [Phycisphaerales bacterium]